MAKDIICPFCGSKDTFKIMRGLDKNFNDNDEKFEIREFGFYDKSTGYSCCRCQKEFGFYAPELTYRRLNKFIFKIVSFEEVQYDLTVIKNESNGANAVVINADKTKKEVNMTCDEWQSFLKDIFSCFVTDWLRNYDDYDSLVGFSWKLKLEFEDKKPKISEGFSMYPKQWEHFVAVMLKYGFDILSWEE